MDYFEKENMLVVPVQVNEYRGEKVKYPNYNPNYKKGMAPFRFCWQSDHSDNWASWDEREDFYPDCSDYFVLGGLVTRGRYFKDGQEIGFGVIDVDNHGDTEKFNKTVEFLSSIGWDDTLIVQTPSGGRHYYFWCLADYMPNHSNGCDEYAIEFKTKGGWLAPNGRDRIVISNKPIKRLQLTADSPFTKLVSIKEKKHYAPRRPTDPDFDIESVEFPDSAPGDRHNTLLSTITRLYAKGCPPEKLKWWGKEFYRRTNRKEQPNEINNIVRDAIAYVDSEATDLDELLADQTETPSVSSPNRLESHSTIEDDKCTVSNIDTPCSVSQEPTDPLTEVKEMFGAEELTGWEGVHAKAILSSKEEIKTYIKEELKSAPPSDLPFIRGMLDKNKMRETWAEAPYETQVKYEMFKESIKMLL